MILQYMFFAKTQKKNRVLRVTIKQFVEFVKFVYNYLKIENIVIDTNK